MNPDIDGRVVSQGNRTLQCDKCLSCGESTKLANDNTKPFLGSTVLRGSPHIKMTGCSSKLLEKHPTEPESRLIGVAQNIFLP